MEGSTFPVPGPADVSSNTTNNSRSACSSEMPNLIQNPLPGPCLGEFSQNQQSILKYSKIHKHTKIKPYQPKTTACRTKEDNSVPFSRATSGCNKSCGNVHEQTSIKTIAPLKSEDDHESTKQNSDGAPFVNRWDLVLATLDNYIEKTSYRQKDYEVPTIFSYKENSLTNDTVKAVLRVERKQCEDMKEVIFTDPVTRVYCPLVYAFEPHLDFLRKFCCSEKPVLFLGMNPGPFGMVQNGVPFGEVTALRDWLGIEGRIHKPKYEHPKRPVLGFSCSRSEVSGKRFWGLFQRLCGAPQTFFRNCFVHNLCPLSFMSASGKNITQPELPLETRRMMNCICDEAFINIVNILKVEVVICLGRFVETRVKSVQRDNPSLRSVRVECLLHPSPLNRSAQREGGWEALAEEQLTKMGMMKYIVPSGIGTDSDDVSVQGNSE